jgi:soluble lytic murein transglycosylase-like protein
MRILLCAATAAALAVPAVAHDKARSRVRAQVAPAPAATAYPAPVMNPFSFFRSFFMPAPQGAVVDRSNKQPRLATAQPAAAPTVDMHQLLPIFRQAPFGTRTAPGETTAPATRSPHGWDSSMDSAIARHAAANGVPLELARRVVKRESGGNPRAVSKGNYGLMQIRLGTARAMGYAGNAQGLLDPEVNMTYAMRYLAGAHRAARGSHDRAVAFYARGYYYEAKAQGFSPYAQQPRGSAAAVGAVASAAGPFGRPDYF